MAKNRAGRLEIPYCWNQSAETEAADRFMLASNVIAGQYSYQI